MPITTTISIREITDVLQQTREETELEEVPENIQVKSKRKKFTGDVKEFAFLIWKTDKGEYARSEFLAYKKKYILWREKKIIEDFIDGVQAGDDFMILDDRIYSYSELPNIEGKYPASGCTTNESGQIILKLDSIKTMENVCIHYGSIGSRFNFCEDTNGEVTGIFYKVRSLQFGEKRYHNIEGMGLIQYSDFYMTDEYARARGFIFCEEDGRWYARGEGPSWLNSDLDGYHSNRTPLYILNSENANIRVGLELEKTQKQTPENIVKMKKAGWRCERDSSVEGGEYITPILPIDDIETAINWIKETGHGIIDLETSQRCGGHIHISLSGKDSLHLYNMIKGYRPLLWSLYPERAVNAYSNKDRDAFAHSVDVGIRQNTVEIRIFPGLDNIRKLRFRLSLIKYMIENPQETIQGSLEKILNCTELRAILSIAYGKNIKRMENFFARVKEFYSVDTGGEMNDTINRIAENIVSGKRESMSRVDIEGAESMPVEI